MTNRFGISLAVFSCFTLISGCLSEANFDLSPDSRLPKWFASKYEENKKNVVVTLDTYAHWPESAYVFKLKEKRKYFQFRNTFWNPPATRFKGEARCIRISLPITFSFYD